MKRKEIFMKHNISTDEKFLRKKIKYSISLFTKRIPYKDTFNNSRMKFCPMIVDNRHITQGTISSEMRVKRRGTHKKLKMSFVMKNTSR